VKLRCRGKVPSSYLGGSGFEFISGNRLSWLKFPLVSPSRYKYTSKWFVDLSGLVRCVIYSRDLAPWVCVCFVVLVSLFRKWVLKSIQLKLLHVTEHSNKSNLELEQEWGGAGRIQTTAHFLHVIMFRHATYLYDYSCLVAGDLV
jgi:hypothetical protein